MHKKVDILCLLWISNIFICKFYWNVNLTWLRFRAIHRSLSITPNISIHQTIPIILLIWLVGILVTLPRALVFQVVNIDPTAGDEKSSINQTYFHPELPFCLEIWDTNEQEMAYFFINNVFVCFLLPLGLIIIWNVIIWKNFRETQYSTSCNANTSSLCSSTSPETRSVCKGIQLQRKLRLLRLFTGLTFTFFAFWLPLYLIMARVKLSYTETFHGSPLEQEIVSVLVPLAQLLGNFNTCVNPVLYALLNQRFRLKWEFCPCFTKLMGTPKSRQNRRRNYSRGLNVPENLCNIRDSRV